MKIKKILAAVAALSIVCGTVPSQPFNNVAIAAKAETYASANDSAADGETNTDIQSETVEIYYKGAYCDSDKAVVKPIISADKITIKESEIPSDRIVYVNINISGAENSYCSTGIKVFYDDLDVDSDEIQFDYAAKYLQTIHVLSRENKSVMLATMGTSDKGKDGVFATIPFILPETAKAGDKFNIYFKYDEDQIFLNYKQDEDGRNMMGYAFNNTVDGYIEIAEDDIEISSSEFEFDAETGTITKYIGKDNEVVIPSEIDGVAVTRIGDSAFESCYDLKEITIPDSVTSIGRTAFWGCSSLSSVTVSDNIKRIGSNAFGATPWLDSKREENPFVIINGILIDTLYCKEEAVVIPDGVISIGDSAFEYDSKITSIILPDSVKSIGEYAFHVCDNLSSVIIPDGVTSIDDYAFLNCSRLSKVTIPESVTEIGKETFGYNSMDGKIASFIINGYEGSAAETYAIENGFEFIAFDESGNLPIFKFDAETGTITKYIGYDTDVVIPSEIKGAAVTSIGYEAFEGCSDITSVTIPDSVTSIGAYAFSKCSALTSVTIPDSVKSIDFCAFSKCSGLTSINIPDSVTQISISTFDRCSSLESIVIPDSVTLIEFGAFSECSALKSVTIPDSVTCIGGCAFSGCSNLESIIIPDSVTLIGSGAFIGTPWLDSKRKENPLVIINEILIDGSTCNGDVVVPDGVVSIGAYAFSKCSALTSVTIPDSVKSIGYKAFEYCTGLESVTIPASVRNIDSVAFNYCSNLKSVTILGKSTILESNSLGYNSDELYIEYYKVKGFTITGCKGSSAETYATENGFEFIEITSGECGENVTWNISDDGVLTISGTGAMKNYNYDDAPFSNNDSIKSIVIEEGVTDIGECAFMHCSNVANVTIPDSVTSIGDRAFYDCESLTSITIPEGVINIGSSAFSNCSGLTEITIPESVKWIGNSAFWGTQWLDSKRKENPCVAVNGIIVDTEACEGDIVIPDGVKSIGDSAFSNKELTSVIIPDSVTSIGDSAFEGCSSLTGITIPESVTSIGDFAFAFCSSLTGITIPDNVTIIGDSAFAGCSSLTDIIIPDSVTSIGENAFNWCMSLGSITIPASVTSIGDYAFTGCNNLTIKGISGSVAHVCAIKYGLKFISLGESDILPERVIIENGKTEDNFEWTLDNFGTLTISGTGEINNGRVDTENEKISLIIEDGITSIGGSAFVGLGGITSVIIPDSVTSIGEDAFNWCMSLGRITIPASVTSIGEYAIGYYYTSYNTPNGLEVGNIKYGNVTIYGEKGSAAETYAKENEFEFIEIGSDEPTPEFTLGDVDGDGTISAMDASAALTYYVMQPEKIEDLGFQFNIKAADWDGNGIINAIDASAILTYYVSH